MTKQTQNGSNLIRAINKKQLSNLLKAKHLSAPILDLPCSVCSKDLEALSMYGTKCTVFTVNKIYNPYRRKFLNQKGIKYEARPLTEARKPEKHQEGGVEGKLSENSKEPEKTRTEKLNPCRRWTLA
ncbi:hypothetical protein Tco_1018749 [Tanacetum coccineum]|uniref:Uncharacterized protein n=1 Tax=Tanacetum coccineum TaxID=301880 RepID=A0ABQ5FVJ0_9ASTR